MLQRIELEKVDVVLENCEAYTFKAEDINLQVQNLGFNIWGKDPFMKAEHIMLEINEKAEAINQDPDSESWQKRIDRDITQIHLHFTNGSQIILWPTWCTDDEYENSFEKDIVEYQPAHETMQRYYIISPTKRKPSDFD